MADPIDPNKILEAVGKLPQVIETLSSGVSKLTDLFGSFFSGGIKGFTDLTGKTKENTEAQKENIRVQQAMNEELDQYVDTTDQAIEKTEEATNKAKELANAGWAAMKVWTGTNMFDKFAQNATSNFTTVSQSFNEFSGNLDKLAKLAPGIFGKLGADGILAAQHMVDMASQGQKAEEGFYGLVSSAGQLNNTFTTTDDVTNKLSYSLSEYIGRMDKVAKANGQTITATMALSKSLDVIPGVLNSTVVSGTGMGSTMDEITTAMRLATGAGRDNEDVINAVRTAYANLAGGQDKQAKVMQRGAELFATTFELQQKLGLSFKDAENLLGHVSERFKNIGDNTSDAAKVMAIFGEELKKTGLTAKASTNIVEGMIDSVSKMQTGNMAFLSQKSGGPGGLQGAAQIESMLHHGKLAEVMQMAQTATRKLFGGQIVTQDEAATSQSKAAQYTKQRAMLQGGIFGIGGGTDDQTAARILEALKSGNVNLLQNTLKTGQGAVKDVADKGAAFQEKNYTELTKVARADERTAINTAAILLASARKDMGTGNKEVDAAFRKVISEAQEQLLHPRINNDITGANTEEETAASRKRTLGNPLGDVWEAAPHVAGALTNPISRALHSGTNTTPTTNNTPTIMPGQGADHNRIAAAAAAAHATAPTRGAPAVAAAHAANTAAQKMEHKVKLDITVNAPQGMIGDIKSDDNVSITIHGINPGMDPEQRSNQNWHR